MTSFYKTTLSQTTRIRVKSQKLRTGSEQEKTRTTDTSCATITGRRDGDRNNKGRGMGSENGAYLSTPPQILPVLGLYLSHLTEGSLSLNRLTSSSSDLCSCHTKQSAFLRLSQSPTAAILTQAVPKMCASAHTSMMHALSKSKVAPNFPQLLAENVVLQQCSSQSYRKTTLQVQFLYHGDLSKFARECELGGFSETHHGY